MFVVSYVFEFEKQNKYQFLTIGDYTFLRVIYFFKEHYYFLIDNFTGLFNSLYKISAERLWATHSSTEQKRLFQLLIFWAILVVFALLLALFEIVAQPENGCIICNIALVSMVVFALLCTINGKTECAVNVIFSVPLFVYAFYISSISLHASIAETIYTSLAWLFAGLVFLLFFSQSSQKIMLYFLIGVFTLAFQLFKANLLFESFFKINSLAANPILVFTAFFTASYFLRKKHIAVTELLNDELNFTKQSLSKVFRDSNFAIAQITAERDETGNIVQLTIDKVNIAFESNFKINLYEVQGQKAEHIFDLLFKNQFSVNELVHFKRKRAKEFHAKNMERWFKVHLLTPEYNKFFLIFEDITTIKNRFLELEENKQKYKVLLEAIPDIFFVIDKDGTYEDFVVKESHLFKIEDTNIIGSTIYDVGFPENMADKIYSCIRAAIENNSIENIEYSLNTPNGTLLYEMRLVKLSPTSVISLSRNITKRKIAEFNLEKALVRAEESDRLKSAFLANLSHEIRTPMNVITNFSRVLCETELESSDKLEIADAIAQNGRQLLNMIDNTIHLSKIETQSVEMKMQFCPINALLREIYNRYFTLLPDSKEIKLNLETDVPNREFGFVTDQYLLLETIAILVDNAVKYTLQGHVTIHYKMIQNKLIKFIVSDTGIGIPVKEQGNIFNRFYRLPNAVNETTSSAGVGLSIAQHYVEMLGGELEFESTPDVGSTFHFTLPFKDGKGFLRVVN